jgi:hypothetical protein
MSDLIRIDNHVEQAQARLVEQFKQKPTILALVDALVTGLQPIEDELNRLLHERTLDAAEGQQLDNLGAIVGQPREGRTDEEYRLWIAARRLVNVATGVPDDFLNLVKTVLPASESRYIPYYPAGFQIRSYGLGDGNGATIYQILATIKPAGVYFGFHYSDADLGTLFTLSDGVIVSDPSKGLGDTADPSVGGKLASVLVS